MVLWGLTVLAALGMAACSEVSSSYGQYYKGRTLTLSVATIDRLPELRYTINAEEQDPRYLLLTPSEDGLELVVVRLEVSNHTATSAILNVDGQSAELRDFLSNKYFPIDVAERVEESEDPPKRRGGSAKVLGLQPDGTFAPNKGFIRGPFELLRGMGIEGWMVFETPKGTKFREFKWRAGDSLTINF
jgi:hypothetical protein